MPRTDRKPSRFRARVLRGFRSPESVVSAIAGVGGAAIFGIGDTTMVRAALAIVVPLGFEVFMLGLIVPLGSGLWHLWAIRKPAPPAELPQ